MTGMQKNLSQFFLYICIMSVYMCSTTIMFTNEAAKAAYDRCVYAFIIHVPCIHTYIHIYRFIHIYVYLRTYMCTSVYKPMSYIYLMPIYMRLTMYTLSHMRIVIMCHIIFMSCIRGEQVILCRHETSPEDIVGMKSAIGILTMRGGMTSHAGVICR
jgi:hypothetical protein